MKHPFDLDSSDLETLDLDFKEQLTEEEIARVGGGIYGPIVCISEPCPGSEGGGNDPYPPLHFFPIPSPSGPPEVTTLAVGEEGGFSPIGVTF
jgi:hypothetical protein